MPTIKDICDKHYQAWIADCSGFLKAVAADLGITITGQANGIIDQMGRSPWISLGNDAELAASKAGESYLVVAGLKASVNGHVAIIMPGSAKPYPTAYWGSIGGHPGRNKALNWCWTKSDLPKVRYYALSIPTPLAGK